VSVRFLPGFHGFGLFSVPVPDSAVFLLGSASWLCLGFIGPTGSARALKGSPIQDYPGSLSRLIPAPLQMVSELYVLNSLVRFSVGGLGGDRRDYRWIVFNYASCHVSTLAVRLARS